MITADDFNAAIEAESLRFLAALEAAEPTAPVLTCPDWQADDLLWHLGEVQDFWGRVVLDGLTEDDQVERISPTRPDSREGLVSFFRRAHGDLHRALSAAADDGVAWTWSDDHTVGFIRRRQAHEALIHRVDAEVVDGRRTPMDPWLCADGVDEALRVMYGGAPAWGRFAPDGRTVRLDATDVGRSWSVVLGRFAGEDPDGPDGAAVDEADFRVVEDSGPAAMAAIAATAADLDCWLWHRPAVGTNERTGDAGPLEAFTAVVSQPID